tara:strand:+ start:50 stop:199 length:150 start_codon:yes stop_codon:yes gene_type:complete
MDQLPLEYKVTMMMGDYNQLIELLQNDKEKWQWMIDDIEGQIIKQLCDI